MLSRMHHHYPASTSRSFTLYSALLHLPRDDFLTKTRATITVYSILIRKQIPRTIFRTFPPHCPVSLWNIISIAVHLIFIIVPVLFYLT
ncbi:hypothetical protein BDN72DRAFT_833580, partial [Pluteus cervinus]